MDLRAKFAPVKIRFVHRKFGFARRLIVGFERRFIDCIAAEVKHAGQRPKNEYLRLFSHKEVALISIVVTGAISNNELVAACHAFTVEERVEL